MQNIKLTLAYKGTAYTGWQKTNTGTSLEEVLSKTLAMILQHPLHLQAASRTDAGVHAQGQVINFFSDTSIPLQKLQCSLNQLLPKDIAVKHIQFASPSFHPTLDATGKEYRYDICSGPIQLPFYRETSWHFPPLLNVSLMKKAALLLLGSHDFSAFCNERALWDRNLVCHMDAIDIVSLPDHRLQIVLAGDHFLYKMARNLSGTLVYIGCGKLRAEAIPALLQSKDRTQAGITAPAHGLRLENVFY